MRSSNRPGQPPGPPSPYFTPGDPTPDHPAGDASPTSSRPAGRLVPPGGYTYTPAPRPRASKAKVVFLVVAGLLVLAFVVNGMFSESRPQEAFPVAPERPVGTLTEDWLLTPAEAAGAHDVSEYNTSPDGAFTGPALITGEDVWAMLTKPGASTPEQVVGIDPADGEVLWRHDVPGGMCGDEIVAGQLACLARDGGWSGVVVNVATGKAHRWEAPGVDSVMLVHLTADGLLVVGDLAPVAPHTMVTLLTLDGEQRWQVDLADVPGAKVLFTTFLQGDVDGQSDTELMMERPRWRDLDDGKVLLWSTPGAALIDPATGDITASQCRRATAAGDHYFCATDEGIVRRDLDGTVAWILPDLDLVTPPETTPARPLAVAEQDRLMAVDWEAGTEHGALHRFRLSGGGFVAGTIPVSGGGDTAHTVAWAGDALLGIEPERDAVTWTMNLDDDDLPFISDVFAVDSTLVTDSYPAMGLDPATGEMLWTARAENGFTFQVVDDRLVSVGSDALAPVQLPGS